MVVGRRMYDYKKSSRDLERVRSIIGPFSPVTRPTVPRRYRIQAEIAASGHQDPRGFLARSATTRQNFPAGEHPTRPNIQTPCNAFLHAEHTRIIASKPIRRL